MSPETHPHTPGGPRSHINSGEVLASATCEQIFRGMNLARRRKWVLGLPLVYGDVLCPRSVKTLILERCPPQPHACQVRRLDWELGGRTPGRVCGMRRISAGAATFYFYKQSDLKRFWQNVNMCVIRAGRIRTICYIINFTL